MGQSSSSSKTKNIIKNIGNNILDSVGNGYDYDTDQEGQMFENTQRDKLVYLFGEDADGMKIVSWDPVKHELKKKRVSL